MILLWQTVVICLLVIGVCVGVSRLTALASRRRRKWQAIAAERRRRNEERIRAYLAGVS